MSDLISFDYAIKYLLKDKADYDIVEGDERAKYSSLSPAGKKLVKKAAEIMKTNEKEYFAPVEKDMAQFLMYLKILTRIAEFSV